MNFTKERDKLCPDPVEDQEEEASAAAHAAADLEEAHVAASAVASEAITIIMDRDFTDTVRFSEDFMEDAWVAFSGWLSFRYFSLFFRCLSL